MQASRRAPGYDLFKLIVAILLLILFFLLNMRRMSPNSAPLIATPETVSAPSSTTLQATAAVSSTFLLQTATPQPLSPESATNAAVPAQSLLISPTTVVESIASVTPPSSPIVGNSPEPMTPTVINSPEPTATPVPASTATPTLSSTPVTAGPVASACDSASSRSRLQNGINATILRRLNFRSSPGIADNWLQTNLPGTKVEVIGGPECLPHFAGAYVWWQIKLPDGQTGWSAESSQFGAFYFMEPIP